MTRRKSIIGALVLCALSLCAFGAANASAAGLTAVTCTEGAGTAEFTEHCKEAKAGGGWITKTIPLNETTEIEGESVTPTINELQATLSGLNVTVTCEMASVTGDVKNIEVGGVMFAHGTNTVIDYKECHAVLTANKAKTCEVEDVATSTKGTILTKPLTTITSEGAKETEDKVTVKPESEEAGAQFAKFKILTTGSECFTSKVVEVTVTGQAVGEIPNAKRSHVTFEGNVGGALKANGQVASYMGTNNAWMKGEPNRTIAAERNH